MERCGAEPGPEDWAIHKMVGNLNYWMKQKG